MGSLRIGLGRETAIGSLVFRKITWTTMQRVGNYKTLLEVKRPVRRLAAVQERAQLAAKNMESIW